MFSQEVLVEHYFVRRIVAEKIKTNIKNEMSISHRSYALNSHVFASIVMAFLLLTLWQSHQRLIFSSGDCVLKSGARGDHAKSQEVPIDKQHKSMHSFINASFVQGGLTP